jgi:inhibitor of cysteine peptidase
MSTINRSGSPSKRVLCRVIVPIVVLGFLTAILIWTLFPGHDRSGRLEPLPTQNTTPTEAHRTMMKAAVGEAVTVDLPSNPSTGYKWELPAVPEGTELVDASFTPPPQGTIGEGGVQHFQLRATRPGSFVFTFLLKRPWEAEVSESTAVELEVE